MRHKMILLALLLTSTLAFAKQTLTPYDYLSKVQVQRFITMMHKKHGFSKSYLKSVFAKTRFDRKTLRRYSGKFKPGSTVGTWQRFKRNAVNFLMYQKAQNFYQKHKKTLKRAQRRYGVDERYIVALMGVESRFGEFTGNHLILDSLATLAFHPNRKQAFFKKELEHLFLFAKERGYDITALKGSFAGAMGCVQQLPSIARKFNFDFDGDGASVWDIEDCIGAIAKFMHRYKWNANIPAAYEATLAPKALLHTLPINRNKKAPLSAIKKAGLKTTRPFPEKSAYVLRVGDKKNGYRYFLGTRNARILKRYNNSTNYAVAIHLIAQKIQPDN